MAVAPAQLSSARWRWRYVPSRSRLPASRRACVRVRGSYRGCGRVKPLCHPSPFPLPLPILPLSIPSPPSPPIYLPIHPANTNTAPVPRTLSTRDTKRYVPPHHPFSVYDWLHHYPVHQTAEVGLGEGREGDGVCVSRCFGRRGGAAVGGEHVRCAVAWALSCYSI